MIWKTTFGNKLDFNLAKILIAFFLIAGAFQAQAQCDSQNVTVTDFYLGDENGDPLQSNSNYQIGEPVDAYLYAEFGGSSGNGHSLYIEYEILVDGVSESFIQQCLYNGESIPATGYHQISSFTWEWGKELELANLYMDWNTNGNTRQQCEPYNRNSQCYSALTNYLVKTPLVANFDYTQSCEDYTVNFTNLTTGGEVDNYSYSWNFGGQGTSSEANPSFTFPEPGEYTYEVTLTSNDGSSQDTYSETITIYEPVNAEISGNEALGCNESAITLEATSPGSQVQLNYQWDTGESTSSIQVNEPGEYNVTITNPVTGCSDSSTVEVVRQDPPEAPVAETTQPTCEIETGSIEITSQGYEFSIDGQNFQSSNTFEGLAAGDYEVYTRNQDECVSEATLITINEQPETPEAPTITSITHATCDKNNGEFEFEVQSDLSYTLTDSENNSYQHENGVYINLAPGNYTLSVSNEECDNEIQVNIEAKEDTTAPDEITLETITAECEAELSAPTTTDNCAGEITATTEDDTYYYEQGEYTVTWVFDDGNGNITEVDQQVVIEDTTAPQEIQIADAEGECEVTVEVPTTEDNCAGTIEGTTNDPMTYTEQGTHEVTWTFDDGNGNTTTATQTVIVEDTTAPEEIQIADAEGECEVTVEVPTTEDNCAGTIEGTTDDPMTYTEQGTHEVTWTFDDGNGNTTTATQTVIVEDTTAPEEIQIADAEGECEVTVEVPTTEDNCAGTIEGTTDDPMTYTEQGTHEVTWTFDDGNGNTTTATQTVIVEDTTAPQEIQIANAEGECEVTVEVPTTEDNCAGTIEGTTEDPMTYTEQGTHEVTWIFDDGNGNITTAVQTVIVEDTTAPEEIQIANAEGECEVTVEVPTTEDNCAGTIEGTTDDPMTYTEQGTHEVTWTFDDGNGNTTTAVQTVIVEDTTAPEEIQIANAEGECEVTVEVPTTEDNCAGTIEGTTEDPMTYTEQGTHEVTWIFDDGNGNITTAVQTVIVEDTTAPEEIQIANAEGECEVTVEVPTTEDNCAGTIEGTTEDPMTYTEQGTHEVTWIFDDGNGNITTAVQTVIVEDTTAPEEIQIADAEGECEVTVDVPTTEDNCAGTIEGTTDDPMTYTEQGTHEVTWTFDDGNGNITTAVQTVIVEDTTAPEEIQIADAEGECEVTVEVPTTEDNCAGTIEGTTDDPMTYTEQGTHEVTWTFDDGNGNITTATQTVIVEDTTAPEEITLETINAECEAELSAPTTTDNCTGEITATTEDDTYYDEQGEYTVTWSFDDGNGNITEVDQQVVIEDTTAPEEIQIANAEGECEVTVEVPTTEDNCAGTIEGTTDDPMTYTEQGTHEVTWTFDDGNGNTTTATQTVIVEDTTAPQEIQIADAEGECEVTVEVPTTEDNCAGTIEGTTEDPMTYTEQGTHEVTWTFDDGNGNTTTATQTVIVEDTTAPEEITLETITAECEAELSAPTTTDNCAGEITATTEDDTYYDEQGEYTVTWSFDDGNGNTTEVDQQVVIEDTTAPQEIQIADAEGECEVTVEVPTTEDNCAGTIEGTTDDPMTYTEQGTHEVTWTFDDGNGNTTTAVQTVIVEDTTAPDEITLETITAECEAELSAPTTTDNCTGEITATTEDDTYYDEQGEYTVTWSFDDGNGNITEVDQQVVIEDTTAPQEIQIADAEGECEVTVNVPTTEDNCAGTIEGTTDDPMTYTEQGTHEVTWTFDDGNGNITTATQTVIVEDTTAPEEITLETINAECEAELSAPTTTDNCTGEITATTEDDTYYDEQGEYTVTWSFDDGNGNITEVDQQVVIEDTTAPEEIQIANAEGECEVTVEVPTTEDNCAGTIEGTTDDPMTYTEQGIHEVTWTFDDGNGNTTTATQTVIVEDTTAPEEITLETITAECEAELSAPTTTDNCAGEITATTEDDTYYDEQGEYTVTWSFDDGNGNITEVDQQVVIEDTTAPEEIQIADAEGECEVTVEVPTTEDNCAGTIEGTTDDPMTYTEQGTHEVTWTFDDGNGNTTTATQTVIVEDTTAPEEITLETITAECEAELSAPTTTDSCAGEITATTEDDTYYDEQGEYTVTWSFDDGNGNITEVDQQVIIEDTTAPEEITLETITAECEVELSAPTTTDNCAGEITATTEDDTYYDEQGEYTVTWSFDDGNGNITEVDQQVVIEDTTAPEIVCPGNMELTFESGESTVVNYETPEISDNCGNANLEQIEGLASGQEFPEGTTTNTFVVTDATGNTAECSFTVTVIVNLDAPELNVIQPDCESATGSISVNTENGLEYSIDGENYQQEGEFSNLEPGTYLVTARNNSGNISPETEVVINEQPENPVTPEVEEFFQATCEEPSGMVILVLTDNVNYQLWDSEGELIAENTEGMFEEIPAGNYSIVTVNEAGCTSEAISLEVDNPQPADIETSSISLCIEDSAFDLFELLEGDYDESGSWEDPDNTGALSGDFIDPAELEVGTYTFNYVIDEGSCPSTTSVTVDINDDCVVLPCGLEDIKDSISKAVTPNGDGFNDYFEIDFADECGFTYNVKIFNRWGSMIYQKENYENNWDGYAQNAVTSNDQLPSGTYFYILEIRNSGFEPIQGYIYLGTK